MAVRFSKIWLLIGVVFTVQLPVTRGQICPPGSTFHPQTGSCMALIRKHYSYINARSYCQNSFTSSKTNREGHLVFIFDTATDDFVKDLLDREVVARALIGLNDRGSSGNYVWGSYNPIRANYTGWAVNPHTHDTDKRAVVITKDGWQEYDDRSRNYFVCQVSADYPIPRIVCPAAEVGQQSPDIRCTIDTSQSLSITGVRFMKAAAVVASCNADTCRPGQGYGQLVDVSNPPETRSSVSWALKLRSVKISDATDWTCSVEFSNSGYWVASQSCSLNVYRKPADIQCSHQFVQTKVTITCTTAQVYPRVGCSWNISYGRNLLTVHNQTISNYVDNAYGYYRATCTASFDVSNAGIYNVTVAMFPIQPNFRIETVKETIVSVAPPQQPPQLSLSGQILRSSWVDVVENQTLTLTCQVPGGDPPVYRTILTCDNILLASEGSSVTMDVRVTREFNGRSCTCSALHAAGYTKTSSVEIRVAYPATVISFRIASRSSNISINRGDEITFSCRADGSPESQIIIQRQNGPTLTNSSTGDITYQKTATCNDTGSYVCLASNMIQGQHHHDSRVVHLYVRCAYQFTDSYSLSQIYKGQVNGSVSINVPVFGYPLPTVTLNSTNHIVSSDDYTLIYTHLEPPYGILSLVFNIHNASFFQNYSLNIINTEGLLTYSFEIVEGDPEIPVSENGGSPDPGVGAIVVGIVAAVIVIIIICVTLSLLKKRGASCTKKKNRSVSTSVQEFKQADYENEPGSRHALEDVPEAEASQYSHYEKIIDFRSDMQDKPVPDANQMLLNAREGDVEYENAVSNL